MVDFNNLMDLQFEIFILMIIGYILRKTNIISKEHRKSLTDLVIYIVLPANIIYSFMIKMDTQIIKSGLTILIVSIKSNYTSLHYRSIYWPVYYDWPNSITKFFKSINPVT